MNRSMLTYFAGFFDGEGSIGIYKHKSKSCRRGHTFELLVQISGTHKTIIELFHNNFGGSFKSYKSKVVKNKQRIWMCQVCSRQALGFLLKIYSYLILKKPQAGIAIQYQQRKRYGQRLSDDEYKFQEECRNKIMELNNKKAKDFASLIQEMPDG